MKGAQVMKKHLSLISTLFIIAGGIDCASPAQAQSVDYGSLEALFGEAITTSATGTPQRASEVATNMTIITADEIRQSGSRSIPQILSRVPGLDILQESANSWDVGVRGYQQPYQPRLLVLIDGRQVFIDDYSRMNWDNLPVNIDDIRQIEVVKGASSALFGSNATGGVVNIITYSPVYDKSNVASMTIGTQDEITGDATATIGLGEFGGIKVSAGGLTMEEFNTARPSGEKTDEVIHPYHRYVAQSSVFKASENLQFNTEANYSQKDGEEAAFVYSLVPVRATTYSAGAGFDWQTPYGLIKSNNYINRYLLNVDTLGVIDSFNTLIVSQLEDQFKIGADHTFRALLEYRYKDFKANNTPTAHPENPNLNENSYAAGGTWLWQINDRLSATNALRLDHNVMFMDGTILSGSPFSYPAYNQAYNTLSANSGLVYKATDKDSFRATYGRGVQNPSEIQSGFNNNLPILPGVNYDVVGNPNLKPTIVDNYELGYDRNIPDIFSVAKFSVYYEFNHDLIALNPTGSLGSDANGLISEAINVGNDHGWGGEVELKGSHPLGFRWDGSYSYQTIRDPSLVVQTLDYSGSAPEHHLRLLLGYTTGRWELDANGQYVTSTNMLRTTVTGASPSPAPTAGYLSLSGRIGYQVNDRITVAVSAFNINRQNTAASPYPEIERQGLLTLTGRF